MKTKRKSLRSFILENRGGIDQYINNDEYLYVWARSEGVNI